MVHIVDEINAIIAALVGGARYGLKIRVPHATLMTVLFRSDLSSKQKLRNIFSLAAEHATNLSAFAAIYKTLLLLLKWSSQKFRRIMRSEKELGKLLGRLLFGKFLCFVFLFFVLARILSHCHNGTFIGIKVGEPRASHAGHPETKFHAFLSGALGGYLVWGNYSSVNHQILLYLFSRVLVALSKRLSPEKHSKIFDSPKAYRLLSATVWGIVMFLFEEDSPDSPKLHNSLKRSMDEIYRFQMSSISSKSVLDEEKNVS